MNTMRDAGEAMILAHEGQLQLAGLLRATTQRLGMRLLDWIARLLNRTGAGTSYTG